MWRTKEGRLLRISDMDTDHIANCANMLRRDGFVNRYGGFGTSALDLFYDEEHSPEKLSKYKELIDELKQRK